MESKTKLSRKKEKMLAQHVKVDTNTENLKNGGFIHVVSEHTYKIVCPVKVYIHMLCSSTWQV